MCVLCVCVCVCGLWAIEASGERLVGCSIVDVIVSHPANGCLFYSML